MGRAFYQWRTTNNVTKTTSYTYNLDSSVASLTNPSGRIITYTPDTAGRPSNVMDHATSIYYATGTCANDVSGNGACYAPQGAIAELQNGSSLFSTHTHNDRLQPLLDVHNHRDCTGLEHHPLHRHRDCREYD